MNDVAVVKEQGRALTAAEFSKLAAVPPELEWFAKLRNPNTRQAYDNDLREFRRFVGIARPEDFRTVTRAHVSAWRKELERQARGADHHSAPAGRLIVLVCLPNAPQGESLKAKRDRAILATLAYHGMHREELCKLKVRDLQRRDRGKTTTREFARSVP